MILRQDLDGMVPAICLQVCRFVGQCILTAQFVLYLRERVSDVCDLEGKEWPPAGRVGNPLQNLIAFVSRSDNVRADSVDDHFGALCHVDCLLARNMALIIVAIAQ